MRGIIDNGVDLIIDVLRQSQAIKASLQKNKGNDSLDIRENEDQSFSYNPRASLVRSDTDGKLMLSRKGQHISGQKRDEYYQKTKNLIENVFSRMTVQDYERLSDAGFQVEELTIESLSFNLQLIKDFRGGLETNKKKAEENIKKPDKTSLSDETITKRMEAENIPVTKESIERIKGALQLSEGIPHMGEKDILYMLHMKLSPTIENIYKARYSSKNNEATERLSDAEWNEMVGQVKEVINSAGVSADIDIIDRSRKLIESNIPLTLDNINQMLDLQQLTETYDKEIVFDKILKGMKEGILPEAALLIEGDPNHANQLVENIQGITEQDIINTIKGNQDITINNLVNSGISVGETTRDEVTTHDEPSLDDLSREQMGRVTTAKRQLEEIRLKMTIEAALRLEKKGIRIDTEALEKVVDKLRLEEELYYKNLYNQLGVEADEDMLQTLRATTEGIEELKTMPAKVLGATLAEVRVQTVSGLLDAGRSILAEAKKAMEAYEALLTKPQSGYGDSIKKAFGNMDSLMEEMGIENTEYNQRAIRIIGYNQMNISHATIEQVKAYDLKVNYLMENINPEITVQLIKNGINPMEMSIDDLNNQIEILKEEGYSSLEKYSTYLHRLDKEGNMSEADRKAYIGIYRLLYQIKKSDGAALGALVKSNQEVTLNHLLSSLRTMRRGGMDYRIDDEFGTIEDISFNSETISDQIEPAFSKSLAQNDHDNSGQGQGYFDGSAQNEIQKAIVGELLDNLTPHRLSQLHQSMQSAILDTRDEALADAKIWDTIGSIPIDQLLDQIKNIEAGSSINQEYYYEKLRELRDIYNNSDQAIRFLNDYKLPCTTTNLLMAGQILNNSGTVFKRLLGLAGEEGDVKDESGETGETDKKDEKTLSGLQKSLQLSDTLIDSKTINDAYNTLDQEVKAVIEDEAVSDEMDFTKLNRLKTIGKQIHFIKTLASREFYHIPIESAGKITNVNLTIIRGKGPGGKVAVSLLSESLGSIRAEASIKDNTLSGYIACDHVEGLKLLETQTDPLKAVLQEDNITIKQLNFCLQQALDTAYTYKNDWDSDVDRSPENEKILYKVAKTLINMVRSAEDQV